MANKNKPLVGIIMGSDSDLETMKQAAKVCDDFGINYEIKVVSAHRTPNFMSSYSSSAEKRGIKIIIAGAGGAAHLPGMTASYTSLPVIGVPIATKALKGLDSLLSIAQMPAGIPVAAVSIGNGTNAGLLAVRILALNNKKLTFKLKKFISEMSKNSLKKNKNLPFSEKK